MISGYILVPLLGIAFLVFAAPEQELGGISTVDTNQTYADFLVDLQAAQTSYFQSNGAYEHTLEQSPFGVDGHTVRVHSYEGPDGVGYTVFVERAAPEGGGYVERAVLNVGPESWRTINWVSDYVSSST